MAPSKTTPPELGPDDLVQFVESHRPRLKAGDYDITVEQVVEVKQTRDEKVSTSDFTPSASMDFSVLGERFSLKDGDIHAVYPAAGSHGKFDHVLPHVILERSTLPWERTPSATGHDDENSPSWLALLLFHQTEIEDREHKKGDPTPPGMATWQVEPAKVLKTASRDGVFFPAYEDCEPHQKGEHRCWEAADDPEDLITVLDVPWVRLREMLPGYEDLRASVHVRRVGAESRDATSAGSPTWVPSGPEVAVIMGNRLPTPAPLDPGAGPAEPRTDRWFAHLVSLEGRYRDTLATDARGPCLSENAELITALSRAFEAKIVTAAGGQTSARAGRLRLAEGRAEMAGDDGGWHPVGDVQLDVQTIIDDLLVRSGYAGQVGRTGRLRVTGFVSFPQNQRLRIAATVFEKGYQELPLGDQLASLCGRLPPIPDDLLGADLRLALALQDHGGGRSLSLPKDTLRKLERWVVARGRYALRRLARPAQTSPAAARNLSDLGVRDQPLDLRVQIHGFTDRVSVTIVSDGTGLTATLALSRSLPAIEFERLDPEPVFDAQQAQPDDRVRLVSLKHWQFYREPEKGGFLEELHQVSQRSGLARFEAIPADFPHGQQSTGVAESAQYLRSGYVAVPHRMRRGDRSVSWYRGPLVSDSRACPTLDLPASGPDALLIYNGRLRMFDASYAAAWELGRLLALEDSGFAVKLFNWKRSHARTLAHLRQSVDHQYLPIHHDPPGVGLTDALAAWFRSLTLLEGVPFNYLVPDERLLPADTIRFFAVDPTWLGCLRDGVFSVGRVLAKDHEDDRVRAEHLERPPQLSGFLLRSAVVSDWPRLMVDGYTAVVANDDTLSDDPHPDYPKLTLERMDRLGPDVLICLFSDRFGREVDMVDLHLPPEVLHFGLEETGQSPTRLIKELRDPLSGEHLWHLEWTDRAAVPGVLAQIRDRVGEAEAPVFQLDEQTFEQLELAGAAPAVIAILRNLAPHRFDVQATEIAAKTPDVGTLDGVDEADAAAYVQACLSQKTLAPRSVSAEQAPLRDFLLEFAGPYVRHPQRVEQIPWRTATAAAAAGRIIELAGLQERVANTMASITRPDTFSAADFGLQMLDSPALVRFVRADPEEGGLSL